MTNPLFPPDADVWLERPRDRIFPTTLMKFISLQEGTIPPSSSFIPFSQHGQGLYQRPSLFARVCDLIGVAPLDLFAPNSCIFSCPIERLLLLS